MTAGPWTLTNEMRSRVLDGTFSNLTAANAVKVGLFQSTSNIGTSSTTYSGLTNEVANGNGYTTGGPAATLSMSGTTSVTLGFSANVTYTASGGSIVARFAVVYEPSGHVLAYCLLDSTPADVTVTSGNTLTISNSNPIITVA
jgi:hypothetical protein